MSFVLLCFLFVCAHTQDSRDWHQWGFDESHSRLQTGDFNWTASCGAENRYRAGTVGSQGVVHANTFYLATSDPAVAAYNLTTGFEIKDWKISFGVNVNYTKDTPISLVFSESKNALIALVPTQSPLGTLPGGTIFSFDVKTRKGTNISFYGSQYNGASGTLFLDGSLLVASFEGCYQAFDVSDPLVPKKSWTFDLGNTTAGRDVQPPVSAGANIAVLADDKLSVLGWNTGAPIVSVDVEKGSWLTFSVLNKIFVAGGLTKTYIYDFGLKILNTIPNVEPLALASNTTAIFVLGVNNQTLWNNGTLQAQPANISLRNFAGNLQWEVNVGTTSDSSKITASVDSAGVVYVVNPENKYSLHALRLSDGVTLWKWKHAIVANVSTPSPYIASYLNESFVFLNGDNQVETYGIGCGAKGKCTDKLCACEDGFHGPSCDLACVGAIDCSGNGVCGYDAKCICNENYYGSNCNDYCTDLETCNGKGQCTDRGLCKCVADQYGDHCDVFCVGNKTCQGFGTCRPNGKCLCEAGGFFSFKVRGGDDCSWVDNLSMFSIIIGVVLLVIECGGMCVCCCIVRSKKSEGRLGKGESQFSRLPNDEM